MKSQTIFHKKLRDVIPFFDWVLIILVGTFLPIAFATLVTSRMPIFGIESFVVLTGSMEPSLPVGSVIYTFKQNSYNLKDIVTFKNNNSETISHRVVQIMPTKNGLSYRVKGDANNAADLDLVPEKNVVGKAITVVPFMGYFINFLRTVPGFIAFIVLPTLIFIGFEIVAIKNELEKEFHKKYMRNIRAA